jgi:hypothetical protein
MFVPYLAAIDPIFFGGFKDVESQEFKAHPPQLNLHINAVGFVKKDER